MSMNRNANFPVGLVDQPKVADRKAMFAEFGNYVEANRHRGPVISHGAFRLTWPFRTTDTEFAAAAVGFFLAAGRAN